MTKFHKRFLLNYSIDIGKLLARPIVAKIVTQIAFPCGQFTDLHAVHLTQLFTLLALPDEDIQEIL